MKKKKKKAGNLFEAKVGEYASGLWSKYNERETKEKQCSLGD